MIWKIYTCINIYVCIYMQKSNKQNYTIQYNLSDIIFKLHRKEEPSFVQWQNHSQWGLSEARLLLIEKKNQNIIPINNVAYVASQWGVVDWFFCSFTPLNLCSKRCRPHRWLKAQKRSSWKVPRMFNIHTNYIRQFFWPWPWFFFILLLKSRQCSILEFRGEAICYQYPEVFFWASLHGGAD